MRDEIDSNAGELRLRRLECARRFRAQLGAPDAFRIGNTPDAEETDVASCYVPTRLERVAHLAVDEDGSSVVLVARIVKPDTLARVLHSIRQEQLST